jgi:hypothetical protein
MVLSCSSPMPHGPRPTGVSVPLETTPVSLDSRDPSERSIGSFAYGGGIAIAGKDSGLHELSDLRIVDGDRLLAVSDGGHLLEGRLLFDETGYLSGLADARVTPLVGERGEPLTGFDGNAEGLDVLPAGDRLVSFERHHRIWLYPADGGPPRPAARPDAQFPPNGGMEALTVYPAAGPGAYLVGSEGGTVWRCSLVAMCHETAFGALVPQGFSLTALAAYGEAGGFAILARAYDPSVGVRVSVRLIGTTAANEGRVLDELTLAAPFTVDNFEGLAVVPRPSGGIRLYLVSDDNGSTTQRTYLLAFDRAAMTHDAASRSRGVLDSFPGGK